jgi:16S rRNA (adenine1518-N6/adenine1519-N6)-dimethyltransferase
MYRLKKSLGQHFLKDENICRKIVELVRERPVRQLLEVGPGGGALTKYFVEWEGLDFRAVELDLEKIEYLTKKYPGLQDRIFHQSILEIGKPFEGRFTVVGNFPYNISTEILFRMLDWKEDIETVIGMFQKEVAQRIAAGKGSKIYGVTSVLLQAYFDVEYCFEVSEQSFNPPPKVKSAVIRLSPRKEVVLFRSEKDFFSLVKSAFNQRRKTLRNAVRGLFSDTFLREDQFLRRAEELSVEEFAALTFDMR